MAPRTQPGANKPISIDYGDPSALDPRYATPGAQVAHVNPNDPRYYVPGSQAIPSVGPQLGGAANGGGSPPPVKVAAPHAVSEPDDEILKLLQKFFDEMNMPFDPNDPYIKSILDNAQASTQQSASNAGVFGPYSQNLAQSAYIKTSAGLQQERQRMAQQALGALTAYKTDKRNFDYQKASDMYTAAQDRWKYDQEHNSDLWRGIGGGLGAIGGGILGGIGGAATGALAGGVGAIPGAITGALSGGSAGYGVGSNLGGAAYQSFGGGTPPPTFRPPGGY